jgi:hypothetical protein
MNEYCGSANASLNLRFEKLQGFKFYLEAISNGQGLHTFTNGLKIKICGRRNKI